jgi:hypothetical protein
MVNDKLLLAGDYIRDSGLPGLVLAGGALGLNQA